MIFYYVREPSFEQRTDGCLTALEPRPSLGPLRASARADYGALAGTTAPHEPWRELRRRLS